MPCEIVDAEIPESCPVGTSVNTLLRVLVASVVSQPNIEALISIRLKVDHSIDQGSPASTRTSGSERSASVRHTHTSLFIKRP